MHRVRVDSSVQTDNINIKKSKTYATGIADKISKKLNLSERSKLLTCAALNFGMGIGWTLAAILGGSSFLVSEASDSIGDGISYLISLYAKNKSKKTKAVAIYTKAAISTVFSVSAIAFSFVRFALKWAVNPILGIALSGGGMAINGLCAVILKPPHDHNHGHKHEDHTHDAHKHDDKGAKVLNKTNWKHTISDLKMGAVGIGFSLLDLIGLPGADLVGGVLGGVVGLKTSFSMFKDGKKLWKEHKEDKAKSHLQAKEIKLGLNSTERNADLKPKTLERFKIEETSHLEEANKPRILHNINPPIDLLKQNTKPKPSLQLYNI